MDELLESDGPPARTAAASWRDKPGQYLFYCAANDLR